MAEKEIKVVVSGDAAGAESALNKAKVAAINAVSSIVEAGKRGAEGLKKIQDESKKAAEGVTGLSKALDTLKNVAALGIVGKVISGISSKIYDMGISAISAAANMRQYEIAFSTMLHSAELGKNILEKLKDFAAKTPFDVPGVVESAQQLIAFGFEAKELIPLLTTLGDASAGLGKGSEGVKQMGLAFGQIKAAGTLKTQDVNQLVNAGIDVWKALSDVSGKSIAEIKEMTEKGMIDSATAIEIITASMQKNFGGLMAATGKEVIGLCNEIEEGIGTGLSIIGDYLTDTFNIKGILAYVASLLGEVTQAFAQAKEEGLSFGEAITKVVPTPLLVALGGLVGLLGAGLVTALMVAKGAVVALAATIGISISPFIGIALAMAGVGAAIALLLAKSETARNLLTGMFDSVADAVSGTFDRISKIINDLSDIFGDSGLSLSEAFLQATGYVIGLFLELYEAGIDCFIGMGKAIADFVVNAATEMIKLVTASGDAGDNLVEIMYNAGMNAYDAIIGWIIKLPETIGNIIKNIVIGFEMSASPTGITVKGVSKAISSMGSEVSAAQEEAAKTVDLSGGNAKGAKSSGGGGGGSSKSGEADLKRREQEINRITEALEKAQASTDKLQSKFSSLKLDIAFDGTAGSERVFAQIEREKQARFQAIKDMLTEQENAVKEATKMRESAEKTGDAGAIARAKSLFDERNALYLTSKEQESALRAEIERQAEEKSMTLKTQFNAAKAEADRAMQEMSMAEFLTYLDSKDAEQYARLQSEQEYRQQMFDWEMESQQTLLDFALTAAESMKNQLASGIASMITEGEKFGNVLKNLAKSVLNMFIQWTVGRAMASAMQKLFAKKDSAVLAATAAADMAALTGPAILNESLHPGSIAAAAATVGSVGSAGSIAAGFGSNAAASAAGSGSSGGNSFFDSLKGLTGSNNTSSSASSFKSPSSFLSSAGVNFTANQNIYGNINTGADSDSLMDDFNSTIGSALRSG